MFDVGFSELVMVELVALLVIDPERLSKIARLAGFGLGKSLRMLASVKDEIKQLFHAEEMRQLMQRQFITDELQKTVNQSEATIMAANAANAAMEPWLNQSQIYTMTSQLEPGNLANLFLKLCRAVLALVDNSVSSVLVQPVYEQKLTIPPLIPVQLIYPLVIFWGFTQLTLKMINYHS
jgi:Sec-independent protein translocase protein TatA